MCVWNRALKEFLLNICTFFVAFNFRQIYWARDSCVVQQPSIEIGVIENDVLFSDFVINHSVNI